jgi:hypothetical protein
MVLHPLLRHRAPVTDVDARAGVLVSIDARSGLACARGDEVRGPVDLGVGELTALALGESSAATIWGCGSLTRRPCKCGSCAAVTLGPVLGALATPKGIVTWGRDGRLRGPSWQARGHNFGLRDSVAEARTLI